MPSRKRYPARFVLRNRLHFAEEILGERYFRCCPGCRKPVRWRIFDLLIRMDDPTPEAEIDEIEWVPEYDAYKIPRFRRAEQALCDVHGDLGWWLVVEAASGILHGWGKDSEQPGRLFKRPKLIHRATERWLSRRRIVPWAGQWRVLDEKARNRAKAKAVQDSRQGRLF